VRRGDAAAAVLLATIACSGCAPHAVTLPSGSGEPFPDYQQALGEATSACRGVRTLTAELALSGRAGGQKLRGRVTAGLAGPASIRLEGVAPFGPPVFILAADARASTLLLPRDHRVLVGERPGAILFALVGLQLGPADLLAILSGCVVADPQAQSGRAFPGGWARIGLGADTEVFLQRGDRQAWAIRSAIRPPLRIDYEGQPGSTVVRITALDQEKGTTDLRIALSQVETNVPLGPEVFTVKTPADATPISLAELRQAGPMGEKR
jgi:hypothetical protein